MNWKRIDNKYLPVYWPIGGTAILWLLLDRLQPAGWVWGMAWTIWSIVWVIAAVCILKQTFVHPRDL